MREDLYPPQPEVLFDQPVRGDSWHPTSERTATGIATLPSMLETPARGWTEEAAVNYDWDNLPPSQLASLKETNRNMNDLNPYVRDQANSLLAAAEKAGFKLIVSETTRSPDRQRYLFSQGRGDNPGSVVTKTLNSNHFAKPEGGQALDLWWEAPGDDPESRAGWDWIQANAPRYGFGVLGDWDAGHIEMKTVPGAARSGAAS